jgi:hypothetical protein
VQEQEQDGRYAFRLPNRWQRIDYDDFRLDVDTSANFIDEYGELIEEKLHGWRFELIQLTIKAMRQLAYGKHLSSEDQQRFNYLLHRYQQEALKDYLP